MLAEAIRNMPRSKKLWLQAVKIEGNTDPVISKRKKRLILERALENIPEEIDIWNEALLIEDVEG